MSASGLMFSRVMAPAWRHLRQADWPVAPLALAVILVTLRLVGAQSYAYWNDWLTSFAALLVIYCAVACARIVLQSLCFDHAFACWSAVGAAVVFAGVPAHVFSQIYLVSVGVPTPLPFYHYEFAAVAAALLVLPLEIESERRRWAKRAAERDAAQRREATLARQLLEARLAALQGQIEPHFIYNTLANVRALIRRDGSAAEQLLQHLIQFLRSAMPDLRAQGTTLGQELDRAQAYLDIIGMRMGERLRFNITASDEARACQIPPLSVMTLVENAVQHGIEPSVAGGNVHVRAICIDGRLRIEVEDDGVGLHAEVGCGVGLVNLQERLDTLFGDTARLRLDPRSGGGMVASVDLPVRHGSLT